MNRRIATEVIQKLLKKVWYTYGYENPCSCIYNNNEYLEVSDGSAFFRFKYFPVVEMLGGEGYLKEGAHPITPLIEKHINKLTTPCELPKADEVKQYCKDHKLSSKVAPPEEDGDLPILNINNKENRILLPTGGLVNPFYLLWALQILGQSTGYWDGEDKLSMIRVQKDEDWNEYALFCAIRAAKTS